MAETELKRRWSRIVGAAIVLFAVIVPVLWFRSLMAGEGELALKPLWSAVESVEFQERTNSRPGPILRRDVGHDNYALLGIPGVGEPLDCPCAPPVPTRAWIVLNEHAASQSIPQLVRFRSYDLDCGFVEQLQATIPDIDDYVLVHLRRMCR